MRLNCLGGNKGPTASHCAGHPLREENSRPEALRYRWTRKRRVAVGETSDGNSPSRNSTASMLFLDGPAFTGIKPGLWNQVVRSTSVPFSDPALAVSSAFLSRPFAPGLSPCWWRISGGGEQTEALIKHFGLAPVKGLSRVGISLLCRLPTWRAGRACSLNKSASDHHQCRFARPPRRMGPRSSASLVLASHRLTMPVSSAWNRPLPIQWLPTCKACLRVDPRVLSFERAETLFASMCEL